MKELNNFFKFNNLQDYLYLNYLRFDDIIQDDYLMVHCDSHSYNSNVYIYSNVQSHGTKIRQKEMIQKEILNDLSGDTAHEFFYQCSINELSNSFIFCLDEKFIKQLLINMGKKTYIFQRTIFFFCTKNSIKESLKKYFKFIDE